MKKKILSLVLCLFMCVSVFAGCNLITRNDKKYYEAIVCTIDFKDGTKDEITKRELLMGYNSYGYNYVQNSGYTMQQAVEETLETIINQHITIKAVEEYYDNLNKTNGKVEGDEGFQPLLNANEKTYLWDITYDAVYGNLKSYYLDIVDIKNGSEDQVTLDKSVFVPYEKKAYLEEVKETVTDEAGNEQTKINYVIKKKTSATTIRDTYENRGMDFEEKSFQEVMYNRLQTLANGTDASAKNWKSAINKYLSDVRKNYSYKKFAGDKECFIFEMQRVYKILHDNYVVEKYETIYNKANYRDDNLANVTVDDVLKLYSSKVRTDYADYVLNKNTSGFESSILSDVASVDYVLQQNDVANYVPANYFYVGYVKLQFNDAQKARLAYLQGEAKAYMSEAEIKKEIDKLYGSVMATVRDEKTGEKTETTISAAQLLQNINYDVQNAGNFVGDEETDKFVLQDKAEAFRKYLYLYSDDDALKGAERNSVFGVRGDEVLAGSTFSGKEDVEKAILALHQGGAGSTSGVVRADDGVYVFFHAGNIENPIPVLDGKFDASTREENILRLASTMLNIFDKKTIFDSLYETLTTDNFSVFENMNLQNLRSGLVKESGINRITNNIKDLY